MTETLPTRGRGLAAVALGLALIVLVWVGTMALTDPAVDTVERWRRIAGPFAVVLVATALLVRHPRVRTLLLGLSIVVAVVVIALAF